MRASNIRVGPLTFLKRAILKKMKAIFVTCVKIIIENTQHFILYCMNSNIKSIREKLFLILNDIFPKFNKISDKAKLSHILNLCTFKNDIDNRIQLTCIENTRFTH